jgi:pantoate--beta-alanine ligase
MDMRQPIILTDVAALRRQVASWRAARETLALVPTMGALHEGHVSLGRIGQARARRVIFSIFVNPTQFAPSEDFSAYPRPFQDDVATLARMGVDAIFAPTTDVMYPKGFVTTVSLKGPAAAELEDRFRPTHFAGVATIVAKLLIQAMPDIAVFGDKDFQQLAVIRQMARDLDLPTLIEGAPTLREADGLAISSRNVYLSREERAVAPLLHRVMREAASAIASGEAPHGVLDYSRQRIEQGGFALDYLEWRDAATLGAPTLKAPSRLLAAARIGTTRLIDNLAVMAGDKT